ncbi:MAG: hypothetical protein GWP10_11520 [Nitrospiraceae bacterium]|nr:hypothetical protein [Nitrospiraceae bacterium]
MSRSRKQNYFVIFAIPQQIKGPGTIYYSKDATVTDIKSKTARFLTFDDAREFAEKNKIELTEATYIGLESFSESDLSMGF